MSQIHVVGIGLAGKASLTPQVQELVAHARFLMGSDRHLSYFADHPAEKWRLDNLDQGMTELQYRLEQGESDLVVLTSGDPLFFGLGRLLLAKLPPQALEFHPHLSSIQLAFNRIKCAWQDATIVSVHGRDLDSLIAPLQQGQPKIALLTDHFNTPSAIARLIRSLDLPLSYQIWVCENLGGEDEKIQTFTPEALEDQSFAPLNVVVLLRQSSPQPLDLTQLPNLGIPDHLFLSFDDRPGLMTKREVRILALGELALQPLQIIWDIGAGTGSVSLEMARLSPSSRIYSIEKTAAGVALIAQNCQRFQVENVEIIAGSAPNALKSLPRPDRIFLGGSGGNLRDILQICQAELRPGGRIVAAFATWEHLATAQDFFANGPWQVQLLQVQLARSVPIAHLMRFSPLNPVTLITACLRQERLDQPQE